jgi:hypothetical protein
MCVHVSIRVGNAVYQHLGFYRLRPEMSEVTKRIYQERTHEHSLFCVSGTPEYIPGII